jgi:catechol 2,3-dioxygenase-like lactoylglutathione lyase family enzyme
MTGRVQLALNVNDLEESIAFYTKLFGIEPAKVRPGYANFAVADPPLKLILMENPGQGGSLNHLGVEVPGTDAVDAEQTRLAEAGLASIDERDTTCCYAREAYTDYDDPAERRHLLRLWLTAHVFASVEDTLRGGIPARRQEN